MTGLPAIRQLVFLAHDLPSTLATARRELGLRAGVEDAEGMAALGFIHQVLTIADTFLEFSAPLGPDTMPGRLVAKRGELGYMVVIQVADIEAVRARARASGLEPVFETPYEGHTITQWHPRDFGTLVEFDQIRPPDTWHMAPRIFQTGSTEVVGDFTEVELAVSDPVASCRRWAEVLDVPAEPDRTWLELSGRTLRFVADTDGRTGLVGVTLPATDRDRAGHSFRLSGVQFRFS